MWALGNVSYLAPWLTRHCRPLQVAASPVGSEATQTTSRAGLHTTQWMRCCLLVQWEPSRPFGSHPDQAPAVRG